MFAASLFDGPRAKRDSAVQQCSSTVPVWFFRVSVDAQGRREATRTIGFRSCRLVSLTGGVDGMDVQDYAKAGFKTVDEMVTLRKAGVNGRGVRDYAKAGLKTVDEILRASQK